MILIGVSCAQWPWCASSEEAPVPTSLLRFVRDRTLDHRPRTEEILTCVLEAKGVETEVVSWRWSIAKEKDSSGQ